MCCKSETNNNNLMESVHSSPKFLRSNCITVNGIGCRRGSLDLTALSGSGEAATGISGDDDGFKTSSSAVSVSAAAAAAAVSPRQRRYSQQHHQRSSLASSSCLDK